MVLLITEIVFDEFGRFAVEVTNTSATDTIDVSNLYIYTPASPSAVGNTFDYMGVPDTMLPGQSFVIGHSAISGVQYATPAYDSDFYDGSYAFTGVAITDGGYADIIDHVGSEGGPAFTDNTSYVGLTTRDPAPVNGTANMDGGGLSEFTVVSPADTSTLGSADCLMAGTGIATPVGTCAVEDLAPGDMVLTTDGRAVPVLWVGQQTLRRRIGMVPQEMAPVRIAAGALGQGLPARALGVTADHGLLMDGCVVNAAALVGVKGIDWVPMQDLPAEFTVYHVETEAHDFIVANGVASETYVDARGRSRFDNYADYLAIAGADRVVRECDLPRVASQRLLPVRLRSALGLDADLDLQMAG
ncbi:MAG: hypothetical protein CMH12_24320 [Maritimibacter sp.]|nr:hypothetical protein [Maritimibacter sp.]